MRKIQFEVQQIYHIFNRGVDKRDIVTNDTDRWRFIIALLIFNQEHIPSHTLWSMDRKGIVTFKKVKKLVSSKNRDPLTRIMAYCLMKNHFHLVVQEIKERGISRFMHKLGTGYAAYFNKKHKRSGRLFQGPYRAVKVTDDTQLKYLLTYINVINPSELIELGIKENGPRDISKIMQHAESYPWSTHQEYLQVRNSPIIEKGIFGEFTSTRYEYEKLCTDMLKILQVPNVTG